MKFFLILCIFMMGSEDARQLRLELKHEEALKKLKEQEDGDPTLLTALTLELSLLQKIQNRKHLRPKQVIIKLGTLNLSDQEELVLMDLSFLLGFIKEGEKAIVRARDKNPELKQRTDEILAAVRKEEIPEGGYFWYRGVFLPLMERDQQRALDQALESLYALNTKGLTWKFKPSSETSNKRRFEARYGDKTGAFLLRAEKLLRNELIEIYNQVRSWIPSYASSGFRESIQHSLQTMKPIRKAAIDLINRYNKPEQPQVDEYRKQLKELYSGYKKLVDSNLIRLRNLGPQKGHELLGAVRCREEVIRNIDFYLRACALPAPPVAKIHGARTAEVTQKHLLPGREFSNLEDALWLVLHYAAGRTMDVLDRADELMRQKDQMTPWEVWIVHTLKCEAIGQYNEQMATSMDKVEREFIHILNGYRMMLGLFPFEVEERCVVASRKHSQEMVDLDYFGHISPVRRNRGPTDRVKLEGYGGGVGENCLVGGGFVSAKGAFEGWYHSPGHHRLLISNAPQTGVGAADSHRMWTMVAGGMDLTWRSLHKDLPPKTRDQLELETSWFAEERKVDLFLRLPDVLPFVAKAAFEAAHSKQAGLQARAPRLLTFLIQNEALETWRPLQVAAVAAAIDLLDIAKSKTVRSQAAELVTPLLDSMYGYDPVASRTKRRPSVVKIRAHWEDTAQWRYRKIPETEIRAPERPLGRKGDGPALTSPLKVLGKQERNKLAKLYGGGSHTERAVDMGLEWLASSQSKDGAWRAKSFALKYGDMELDGQDPGRGNNEWEIAMTGLSLLALIYGGNTTVEGEYAEQVDRGARFLMSKIVDYGKFETTSSHYMYSHAMATQALCELYAYTADPFIGIHAQLCVDYLIYAQHAPTGGWRYLAKEAGDTSVTGWVILALHSARKAQLDVAGLRDALRFLESVTYPCYFEVGYLNNHDRSSSRLCAVGASARLFITGQKQDSRILFNARRLMRDLPKENRIDFYYWYYGTLFMFQMGGKNWDKWNKALIPILLKEQVDDKGSVFHGSFFPRGEWSGHGGRLYQTSLGLLMLMTYYRYDRGIKPKLGSWTGSLKKEADPYLENIKNSQDQVAMEVTERKLVDKFGPALTSVVVQWLKKEGLETPFRKRLSCLLSRCATHRYEKMILKLMPLEKDAEVKRNLMLALEGISSVLSVETLIPYLEDPDRETRGFCARALGRIGDQRGVKPLCDRLLKENDNWCKRQIEEALQRLSHKEAVTQMINDALKNRDEGRLLIQDNLRILERLGLAKLLLEAREKEPKIYKRVLKVLKQYKQWAAAPMALVGLESADEKVRTESVKAIRAITRKHLGYDPKASKEDRAKALEKWKAWWKDHIKDYQL